MAKFIRCSAGLHQYDAERYSTCPKCPTQRIHSSDVDELQKTTTRRVDRPSSKEDVKGYSNPEPNPANPAGVSHNEAHTQVVKTGQRKPVTGWLVVVEGPGKGAGVPIYHGVNSVGRDPAQIIVLNFSGEQDREIARENQARITYDTKGNVFYLQHGEGTNLTYLNDNPVLELKELFAYDRITIGSTTLVFIPFCGDRFQWPLD